MLRHVCIVLALAMAPVSAAIAAPFTNGSFEQSTLPGIGVWTNLPEGSTALPGWTIWDNGVDHIGTYWQAAHGSRSLDLNGDNFGGTIEQEFDTHPGAVYIVRFALSGSPYGGPATKSVLAAWSSSLPNRGAGGGTRFDFTPAPGDGPDSMGWVYHEFAFRAIGFTSRIRFASWTDDRVYGPALDDVSVTELPEPSTMLLLGTGLVGAALRRRRRGRASTASSCRSAAISARASGRGRSAIS